MSKNLKTSLIWVGEFMDTDKLKKNYNNCPTSRFVFWIGDKLCLAYRTVTVVGDISVKLMPFLDNLGTTLVNPLPSFHPLDVFVGVATAVIARLVLIYKDKHRKKICSR